MNRPAGRPALIIANGDLPPRAIVRSLARSVRAAAGLIVCADGGARHAIALGVRPSVIIGDLDSLPAGHRTKFRGVPVVRDRDQETTDLEKAILLCRAGGCSSAVVAGAVGDRIDHSTGALGCIRKYGRAIALTILDRKGEIRLLARSEKVAFRRGETFSLIPLGRCRGVVVRGAAFPLSGESLELGVREGISNRATGRAVTIRHSTGTLLLYRFHPPPASRGRRRAGRP